MSTFDLLLTPRGYSASRAKDYRDLIPPLVAGLLLIARWIDRARQRAALAALDDQMLRDIGITRIEAARECEKPFWR